MILVRLTYVAVLIFIPDYVFSQKISKRKRSDDHVPCEQGWFYFKEKCFKISEPGEKLTWKKAADHCETLGSNLATVESKEENDFLVTLLLLEIQASAWIGLHDMVNESDYKWQSGSTSEYRNWRASEPSGFNLENEDCAQLLVDLFHDSVGEWNDNECQHSINYICEKKSSPGKRSPNLLNCSSAEGGGVRFKESCYHLVADKTSWDNAEQHCVDNYGGHLITVLDKTVDFYLNYLLQDNEDNLWIGIKIQDQLQQRWTSGWYVGYNGFSEEHQDFIEGTCVVRSQRKKWNIVPCSKEYSFICEKSKATIPVLKKPENDSICPRTPAGWRDMGGEFCYFIETKNTLSWSDANFQCIRRGSSLLSIHSNAESEILHPFIQYSHVAAYVGLIRYYSEDNQFKWTDGSPLDFLNWAAGEPNSEHEICVEVRASDMTWNDVSCEHRRPYICAIRKILANSTSEEPVDHFGSSAKPYVASEEPVDNSESSVAPNSTSAKNSDKVKASGVSQKVIIAVVITILLLILLGVVLCKIKPWNKIRKKRITDEMPNYKDMNEDS